MTRRPRLTLGLLEGRLTPTGNLTTRLVAGSLYVTGDREWNSVAVTQEAPNQFTITPLDDTTVNGRPDPVTVSGVTRDLVLRLGGGHDRVRLGAGYGPEDPEHPIVVGRDLVIHGGPGDNIIENPPRSAVTTGRHIRITHGGGWDEALFYGRVTVGGDFTALNGNGGGGVAFTPEGWGVFAGPSSVRGDLTIRNGVGGGSNTLSDVSVGGDVRIVNGRARADVEVFNALWAVQGPAVWVGGDVTFRSAGGGVVTNALADADVRGDVRFETGPGESVNVVLGIERHATVGGDLTVRAGAGGTRVDLGANQYPATGLTVGGNVDVRTGPGADPVTLLRARLHGDVAIDTGAGADGVQVDDTLFGGRLTLTTGWGADTVLFETEAGDDFPPETFGGTTDLWEPSAIHLGPGDDVLRLGVVGDPRRQVRLFDVLRAGGGAGSDLLDAANVTPANRLRAVSFERSGPAPGFARPARSGVGGGFDHVKGVEAADLDGWPDLAFGNLGDASVAVPLNTQKAK